MQYLNIIMAACHISHHDHISACPNK